MKKIRNMMTLTAVALFALLPVSLLAAPKKASPIVVSINDVPNGAPVIQVQGAPNGYGIYTDEIIADPLIEEGAAVVLYDVDLGGLIPDWGGRFTVPNAPQWYRTAVDIVWITHDPGMVQPGALVVGFNSAFPGTYYLNPGLEFPPGTPLNTDVDLGPVTDNWVTVYANDTLVVRYKPHTYRLHDQVERPFKATGIISLTPTSPAGGTFGVVGNATHLGEFVGAGTYEIYSVVGPKVFMRVAATWTAANGDTITFEAPEWVIDYGATPPTSTGEAHVIGGTGRFAGASGSFFSEISPAGITPGVPNTLTVEGTISY